jgi:hypothetical protein
VVVNGEEQYPVSNVEDSRWYHHQSLYGIRWTVYDKASWESGMFVDGRHVVAEVHQRYPFKLGLVEVLGGHQSKQGDTVIAQ